VPEHSADLEDPMGGVRRQRLQAAEQITRSLRVWRKAAGAGPVDVQQAAARGISGPGGALPFQDRIQKSFGRHDISHIQAHSDSRAGQSSRAMNALAYATGSDVAFAGTPDLHTAAHEAAHVVQQKGGVQLAGGVSEEGDAHERHADAVADRVVAGESSEALLDKASGVAEPSLQAKAASGAGLAVQFAKPGNKAASQALTSGVVAKKPPALKSGERSGGTGFGNREGLLPADDGGKPITYTEYDVNSYDGKKRDAERIVVGSDGRHWYTSDHYASFSEVK
jgi:guanyl-specific ribonuclease Sa